MKVEEPLIFEKSKPGKIGILIEEEEDSFLQEIDPTLLREEIKGFPELSEPEVIRHFHRLARMNWAVTLGIYPLGSCTMKYNPVLNEEVAGLRGFLELHPEQDMEDIQGILEIYWRLEQLLLQLTGMDAATLLPAAGAHGELTAIMMVKKFFAEKGENREFVLIQDSAHGTNPASASIAGFKTREIKSTRSGMLDVAALEKVMDEKVALMMMTVPNTLGIFETQIVEIAEIVHSKGGFVYCDGANFNSFVAKILPSRMGIDLMHVNLHKTFSTPHGGGGPGAGPVLVKKELEPFLPIPRIVKEDGKFKVSCDFPLSIGRIKSFFGQTAVIVRALAYILSMGGEGLKRVAEVCVLNANYIRRMLEEFFYLPYKSDSLHEVVFSDKFQREKGVTAMDIAKRLLDYGVHSPTVFFPLIVKGALMIEPTETESKEELDRFIEAMRKIAQEIEENPEVVKTAPHSTPVKRCDEVLAARRLKVRWE